MHDLSSDAVYNGQPILFTMILVPYNSALMVAFLYS